MPGFPSLKDFVEAMGVAWPIAFAICLASCGTLLAAHLGVPYVAHLADWLQTLVFLLAAFSGAVCLTAVFRELISAGKKLLSLREEKKDQAQRLSRLGNLPDHEQEIMAFLCTTNTQFFPAHRADGRLVGLIEKGLINRQPGEHTILNWPHAIPDFIWDEMRRRPDKFFLDLRIFGNPLAPGRL
jgi:hypothetical protein